MRVDSNGVSLLFGFDDIEVVLLDVGGVLVADYWETVLLGVDGVADRFGLDRCDVGAAGKKLWEQFCRSERLEEDYWGEFSQVFGVDVDDELIGEFDKLVGVCVGAEKLLGEAVSSDIYVGLISNNTSFWFEKQMLLGGWDDLFDSDLVFLSHREGVTKGDPGGLFEVAARVVDPVSTLVVDDRLENIGIALRYGFAALQVIG